jgi:hypothetical protein
MQTAGVNQDLETIAKYPKTNCGKCKNRGKRVKKKIGQKVKLCLYVLIEPRNNLSDGTCRVLDQCRTGEALAL